MQCAVGHAYVSCTCKYGRGNSPMDGSIGGCRWVDVVIGGFVATYVVGSLVVSRRGRWEKTRTLKLYTLETRRQLRTFEIGQ